MVPVLFILVVFVLVALIALIWHRKSRTLSPQTEKYLEQIRAHQILLKPDKPAGTYSGLFAKRLMRFKFNPTIQIIAIIEHDIGEDRLWIYPQNHRFKSDKFRGILERNRAWSGNKGFDETFILAGQPRIFANAVIHPAKRVQSQLLNYPRTVIEVNQHGVILTPDTKQSQGMTDQTWRDLLGLTCDIAEYVEAQYQPLMYAGIEVDEDAYPNHAGGHLK